MITRKLILFVAAVAAIAQTTPRRGSINVEHYNLDVEINPKTQTLSGTAEIRFVPNDDRLGGITFELNDALRVTKATDDTGQAVGFNKGPQANQFTLSLTSQMQKGKAKSVKVSFDGRLAGEEESPIYGIRFAAIKPEISYLMYPARWFPINDYTADRYTMSLKATVPANYKVLSNGIETKTASGDKVTYNFEFRQPGFPGNVAVVQGDAQRVSAAGANSSFYFRETKPMANAYGEEVGKALSYFSSLYGLAPTTNLTFVETERGAPGGYSTPGLIFFSPSAIGSAVNVRLVANQVARQWWGNQVSTTSRNGLWITNGLARYSEVMYLEQQNGPGAAEAEVRDIYVEALTSDQAPLSQSGRYEDYSPEFVAATSAKGASVFNMMRLLLGDKGYQQFLTTLSTKYAGKAVSREDLREITDGIAGQTTDYFYIQWVESNGTPEFKLEYTVFRTAKGFRIVGKVRNDLDTFRMPVELRVETEGNPEFKTVEVIGASSEFVVETFGKPKSVQMDPNGKLLRFSNSIRVQVAIRKGEQLVDANEFTEALKEYQKALDVNRASSLAHYRVADVFFMQNNYQSAANEFREALNGDLDPKWVEVWGHINLGKIFDITGQRERAVNEYNLAIRTKDNTQGAQEEAAKYLKEPYKRQTRSE